MCALCTVRNRSIPRAKHCRTNPSILRPDPQHQLKPCVHPPRYCCHSNSLRAYTWPAPQTATKSPSLVRFWRDILALALGFAIMLALGFAIMFMSPTGIEMRCFGPDVIASTSLSFSFPSQPCILPLLHPRHPPTLTQAKSVVAPAEWCSRSAARGGTTSGTPPQSACSTKMVRTNMVRRKDLRHPRLDRTTHV